MWLDGIDQQRLSLLRQGDCLTRDWNQGGRQRASRQSVSVIIVVVAQKDTAAADASDVVAIAVDVAAANVVAVAVAVAAVAVTAATVIAAAALAVAAAVAVTAVAVVVAECVVGLRGTPSAGRTCSKWQYCHCCSRQAFGSHHRKLVHSR